MSKASPDRIASASVAAKANFSGFRRAIGEEAFPRAFAASPGRIAAAVERRNSHQAKRTPRSRRRAVVASAIGASAPA